MLNSKTLTVKIARAGVIAALYAATSFVSAPIASGAIQLRLSEALTLLPLIFPESIPALFIGCMISNLLTGCAVYDVIFGSLITLVAAALTFLVGRIINSAPIKIVVGGIFPVLLNALLLPVVWLFCYGTNEYIYLVQVAFLTVGQGISVYALGVPLFLSVNKIISKKDR